MDNPVNNHEHHAQKKYTIREFAPLIALFALVITFTLGRQLYSGFTLKGAMNDFMAGFFLLFSVLKLINLHGFAQAYATYDIVAQRIKGYAYLYPFLELGLGLCYLFRLVPFWTNIFTIVLMLISALGVAIELSKKKEIMCACLGVVFKVPMTYVTLLEDLLMAGMAALMLFLE